MTGTHCTKTHITILWISIFRYAASIHNSEVELRKKKQYTKRWIKLPLLSFKYKTIDSSHPFFLIGYYICLYIYIYIGGILFPDCWCTQYNMTWHSLSVTCCRSWFSPGTPVSYINKTDHYNITEILLKVVLNATTLTL